MAFFNMFAASVSFKNQTEASDRLLKNLSQSVGGFWEKKDHITSKAMKSLA